MSYLLFTTDELYFSRGPQTSDYPIGAGPGSAERERSMVPPRPLSPAPTDVAQRDEARAPASQALIVVAERELLAALGVQTLPPFGLYARLSPAEAAVFDRAVRTICREAHRLGVRAEELVIAIKQAWSLLATERATRLGDRDGDVLREVVSSSIEYFFDSRDADGPHAPQ
jgi:hypothetical protein